MLYSKRNQGFTLIEVVVVMAIIAVLAVLVTGAIGIARRMARDTQRMNDLKTLQTALIAYNTKTKSWPDNHFPTSSCFIGVDGCLEELKNEGVLSILPTAPNGNNSGTGTFDYNPGNYMYFNYDDRAMLWAFLENPQKGPETNGWRCDWNDPATPDDKPYCISINH